MQKNIIFAFRHTWPRNAFRQFVFHRMGLYKKERLKFHYSFLFSKEGLFSGYRRFDTRISSTEVLDWQHPELDSVNLLYPSILMRCVMFPAILSASAPDDVRLTATSDYLGARDSIIIVHKSACIEEDIRRLKKQNNILLYDILDGIDKSLEKKIDLLDGLILCSVNGMDLYKSTPWITKPLFFLAHCTDPRLPERNTDLDSFSPIFNGAPENVLLYPSLEPLLPVAFCYKQYMGLEEWLQKTLNANFFYAVRPPLEGMRIKPFVKGFTAAKLNSNILIHKDDGDALHYLGEDYPYLIKEDLSEEVVLRYMRKAKEEFGGPEWHRGLEIMRSIRNDFSDETMSKQFWDMIAHFS